MKEKSPWTMFSVLLILASSALFLPAIASDQTSNQSGKSIDGSGTFGSLRMALTGIHEETGLQFVILGGPGAYHEVDVMFHKVTTEEAVYKIAALAHATVTHCCPDTYLFQPVTKGMGHKLFAPKKGLKWRKLVLPYSLPTDFPNDFGWEFWDRGWSYDHNDDENMLTADYPNPDHLKSPQGVDRVYVLPSGETLLLYSTAGGFQQVRNEMEKTDLRRATFSSSVLTARAADIKTLGNVAKILTDKTMPRIYDKMPSDSTSYLNDYGAHQVVPQGQPIGVEGGLQSKPDDLKVSFSCIPKFNDDGTVTINAKAALLRYDLTGAKDGSFPLAKTLTTISETETLHVGEILALQGLFEPVSTANPGEVRQVIIFIKLLALSQHTHK